RFANAAVPVVADSLLSPFRTVGIVWAVLGVVSIVSGVSSADARRLRQAPRTRTTEYPSFTRGRGQ
ncbi:MAG: hypothetical protein RL743_574, partial [Actinomycetota bacterium]